GLDITGERLLGQALQADALENDANFARLVFELCDSALADNRPHVAHQLLSALAWHPRFREEAEQRLRRLPTLAWLRNNGVPELLRDMGFEILLGMATLGSAEVVGRVAEHALERVLFRYGVSSATRQAAGSLTSLAVTSGTLPAFHMGLESIQQGTTQNWNLRNYGSQFVRNLSTLGMFRGINGAMRAMGASRATNYFANLGGFLVSDFVNDPTHFELTPQEIARALREDLTLRLSLGLANHLSGGRLNRLQQATERNYQIENPNPASIRAEWNRWLDQSAEGIYRLFPEPLRMMMGIPGGEGGNDGRNEGTFLFEYPKEVKAILDAFDTQGLDAARIRLRSFVAALHNPAMKPRRFVTMLQGLMDGGCDLLDGNFGDEIYAEAMEVMANADLNQAGPRAFVQKLFEPISLSNTDPQQSGFLFALIRNPRVSKALVGRAQARLIEWLETDDADAEHVTENIFSNLEMSLSWERDPFGAREALVQASLAWARRNPDWFCSESGPHLAGALLSRGYPLKPSDASYLIGIMTDSVMDLSLREESRVVIIRVLDSIAESPHAHAEIRNHLQESLLQLRNRFFENSVRILRDPSLMPYGAREQLVGAPELNYHELNYLLGHSSIEESRLQILGGEILAAFGTLEQGSGSYELAVALAQLGLRNPRSGPETRQHFATILVRALGAGVPADLDPNEAERRSNLLRDVVETLRSLPREELESHALALTRDLLANTEATRRRAVSALEQVLPLLRGSFVLQGNFARLSRENRRRGMEPVLRRLSRLLDGSGT
ncbi:MAG: hypothetical protein K8R69_03145, partial [Deltaproteobacteria bacterium]|nr:hypothetical protein [Deltaproteobacteria bacterium]